MSALPIVANFGREPRATVTRSRATKTEAGLEDAPCRVRHSSFVAPNYLAYIRAYLACIQYGRGARRNCSSRQSMAHRRRGQLGGCTTVRLNDSRPFAPHGKDSAPCAFLAFLASLNLADYKSTLAGTGRPRLPVDGMWANSSPPQHISLSLT